MYHHAPRAVFGALVAALGATACADSGGAAARGINSTSTTLAAKAGAHRPGRKELINVPPDPLDMPATSSTLWPHNMFSGTGVQSWPVLPGSSSYVSTFNYDYHHDYGNVGINQMPIYAVPADEPRARVSVQPGCQDFLRSTGDTVPIPPYAQLLGTSDNPLIVYQPSTGNDWELWKAHRNADGTYSACWGGKLDMRRSDGVFPRFFGMSATGISYLATTITENDVAAGSIDHAVAILLPQCNGWVYPADRGDCGSTPGAAAEGQWFRFPAGLAMPKGLTPFGQMVFRAIQDYGAVVTDFSAAVVVEVEQTSDWSAQGHTGPNPIVRSWDGQQTWQLLNSLPWSSLQAVAPPGYPDR